MSEDDVEMTIPCSESAYLISKEDLEKMDPNLHEQMEKRGIKFIHSIQEWIRR